MDKKAVRKLVLKKETVRELTPQELSEAAGGVHYTDDHGTKLCSACGVGYTCTCYETMFPCIG